MARVRILVNVNLLMVETPVFLSPKGAAVVLFNWSGEPQPRLTINL